MTSSPASKQSQVTRDSITFVAPSIVFAVERFHLAFLIIFDLERVVRCIFLPPNYANNELYILIYMILTSCQESFFSLGSGS